MDVGVGLGEGGGEDGDRLGDGDQFAGFGEWGSDGRCCRGRGDIGVHYRRGIKELEAWVNAIWGEVSSVLLTDKIELLLLGQVP